MDGILKALGANAYPVSESGNGPAPVGLTSPAQQARVTAAAARFAALPAGARRAWLTALRTGTITLAQVP